MSHNKCFFGRGWIWSSTRSSFIEPTLDYPQTASRSVQPFLHTVQPRDQRTDHAACEMHSEDPRLHTVCRRCSPTMLVMLFVVLSSWPRTARISESQLGRVFSRSNALFLSSSRLRLSYDVFHYVWKLRWRCVRQLVAWHSGRTSVSAGKLPLSCALDLRLMRDHYCG